MKVAIVGLGRMGRIIADALDRRAVEIVSVFDPDPRLGTTYSAGGSPSNNAIPVYPAFDPALCRSADLAILAHGTTLEQLSGVAMQCAKAGISVLSIAEDGFDPHFPDERDELARTLDLAFREGNAALLCSGVQDAFWHHIPLALSGNMLDLTAIEGTNIADLSSLGPAVFGVLPIGLRRDEVDDELLSGFAPERFCFDVAARPLFRALDLEVLSSKSSIEPIYSKAPMAYSELEVEIGADCVRGLSEVTQFQLSDGISARVELGFAFLEDGESSINRWTFRGTPDVTVLTDPFPGNIVTCAALINRIPDIAELSPGFHCVDELGPVRWRKRLETPKTVPERADGLLDLRIVRRTMATDDIVVLDLERTDGAALPSFDAGAHIDLHLPGGLVRQYSLCGAPDAAGQWRIAVLRDPHSRGGSTAVHALEAGLAVTASTPRNHFPLAEVMDEAILLGGGIGVTPLLAMAHHLHQVGRPFTLHYAARAQDRMAFKEELAAAPFADCVHLHFDDGLPEQLLNVAVAIGHPAPGRHVYCCGPSGFLDHVLDSAKKCGWPSEQVHFERFSAEVDLHGASFSVVAAKSGVTVDVSDGDTIVAALQRAGVDVPLSCEQGVCGTCVTRVLEGLPDHRDLYLTNSERAANNQMMICCSRALSPRLVLDI